MIRWFQLETPRSVSAALTASPAAAKSPPDQTRSFRRRSWTSSPLGQSRPEAQASVLRSHAILATFKRGEGEVFNTGTTEWAHGLKAKNPFVEVITHNVLRRFGVTRA